MDENRNRVNRYESETTKALLGMERLTAKQAAEIAAKKSKTIDQLLEVIKDQSEFGRWFILEEYVSSDVLVGLVNLGYNVSKCSDQFGNELIRISW